MPLPLAFLGSLLGGSPLTKIIGAVALGAAVFAGIQTWRLSAQERKADELLEQVGSLQASLDQAIDVANANADATREVERLSRVNEEALVADRNAALAVAARRVKVTETVHAIIRETPATCPVAPSVRGVLVELYGQPAP